MLLAGFKSISRVQFLRVERNQRKPRNLSASKVKCYTVIFCEFEYSFTGSPTNFRVRVIYICMGIIMLA